MELIEVSSDPRCDERCQAKEPEKIANHQDITKVTSVARTTSSSTNAAIDTINELSLNVLFYLLKAYWCDFVDPDGTDGKTFDCLPTSDPRAFDVIGMSPHALNLKSKSIVMISWYLNHKQGVVHRLRHSFVDDPSVLFTLNCLTDCRRSCFFPENVFTPNFG